MKAWWIAVVMFLFGFIVCYFLFSYRNNKQLQTKNIQEISREISSPEQNKVMEEFFVATDEAEQKEQTKIKTDLNKEKSSISGRLCYPSEYIPAGKIQAKNIQNQEIIDFPTQVNQTSYEISLAEGEYILRFLTDKQISGYYTNECPTGAEVTCEVEPRTLKVIKITAKQVIKDISLCDFYYQTEPEF